MLYRQGGRLVVAMSLLLLTLVGAAGRPAAAATPAQSPPPKTTPAAAQAMPTGEPTPEPTLDGRALAGRQVYLKQYCGLCHTLTAAGTTGPFGPPHDHLATTARQRIRDPAYGGKAVTVAQYIRESIVAPKAYAVPGFGHTSHPMPEYSFLPKADIDALVYFLLQQK
jgi:cytochrome c5